MRKAWVIMVGAALAWSACGDSGDGDITGSDPLASIEVTPAVDTIAPGTSLQLNAVARDASGSSVSANISWSSSNESVCIVSGSGLVGGMTVGAATITAADGGVSGTARITVRAQVASVEVTPTTTTIPLGETVQLTATPRDATGTALSGRTVTWQSSNTTVAMVDATGLVVGMAVGTAAITATAGGVGGTATVTVPVPVASVEVTPPTSTIRSGATVQLTATTRDASNNTLTGRTITWSSSSDAVATVDASGLVTGQGNGTATITAMSEGQSGTASVTVWVGVTGAWTGRVPLLPCDFTMSLTEDAGGAIAGSWVEDLFCQPPTSWTVSGTNNTLGVADSVVFTVTSGISTFTFTGTFDGSGNLSGVVNGIGLIDDPTTATRTSFTPAPGFTARAAPPASGAGPRKELAKSVRR